MGEYSTVWFYNRRTNKKFSDSICDDPSSAYYNELVIECGPSQLSAHLNPDHTVGRETDDLYGVDTSDLIWADSEEELDRLVAVAAEGGAA